MVLVAYCHGLRVSELVALGWDQIDFDKANLHVRRAWEARPIVQPIREDVLRALRRLREEQAPKSPFVFSTGRGAPVTSAAFARMVGRAGEAAELGFSAHPPMLRHACGFALVYKGYDRRALQIYLGYKYIRHTARYYKECLLDQSKKHL
jgi:integrase